ncbi:MAG: ATP phosphoribosyltransferase regulatory subunit, partial [Bacteroidales bacterium]|nr:ATP phosphoribosyltransferase regulatory subunit [Bacteroidales bacterium]
IIDLVYHKLNISVTIKLNNRKILAGIADFIGYPDKITTITVAIDKLDKIGIDKVKEELMANGLSNEAIQKLEPVLTLSGDNESKLSELKKILSESEIGLKGIEEVEYILSMLKETPINTRLDIDLTLARGLNYYTGAIIEVKANDVSIGSVCGGGRYDDLTGIFGLKDVSGVGISFGADRIYDVMTQLELFPEDVTDAGKALFINFGEKEQGYCLKALSALRKEGIKAEIYPDIVKLKKQMTYANARNIPYVILAGDQEIESNTYTLKDMKTGEQEKLCLEDLMEKLR